jgi:hypothetical protein
MTTEHVERVLRALHISGRRLVKMGERWGVLGPEGRRRKPRLTLEADEVDKLAREGAIVAADAETYLLCGVNPEPQHHVSPWAFIAAGLRRSANSNGIGFAALAIKARRGEGPLTLRHVNAGLQLIADAERRENTDRITMDWDAGPVDRQRRGGRAGGLRGMAIDAARRLRRARRMTDPQRWEMAWALCVEAVPLRTLRQRFGLGQRNAGEAFAAAMEAVANAYER